MKGWEFNAIEYSNSKDVGICPYCGSKNVKAEEFVSERHYSVSFLCLDCHNGAHFDGIVQKDKQ